MVDQAAFVQENVPLSLFPFLAMVAHIVPIIGRLYSLFPLPGFCYPNIQSSRTFLFCQRTA